MNMQRDLKEKFRNITPSPVSGRIPVRAIRLIILLVLLAVAQGYRQSRISLLEPLDANSDSTQDPETLSFEEELAEPLVINSGAGRTTAFDPYQRSTGGAASSQASRGSAETSGTASTDAWSQRQQRIFEAMKQRRPTQRIETIDPVTGGTITRMEPSSNTVLIFHLIDSPHTITLKGENVTVEDYRLGTSLLPSGKPVTSVGQLQPKQYVLAKDNNFWYPATVDHIEGGSVFVTLPHYQKYLNFKIVVLFQAKLQQLQHPHDHIPLFPPSLVAAGTPHPTLPHSPFPHAGTSPGNPVPNISMTPQIPTPHIPTPHIPRPNIPTPNIPRPNITPPVVPIPDVRPSPFPGWPSWGPRNDQKQPKI